MRTEHLHNLVVQRFIPTYIGNDRSQFPRQFQPAYKIPLPKKLNQSMAKKTFENVNAITHQWQQPTSRRDNPQIFPQTNSPFKEQKLLIQNHIDYSDFVHQQYKQKELSRQLVAKRLIQIQQQKRRKKPVMTSQKGVHSILQDLVAQIQGILAAKQSQRTVYYRTDSPYALDSLKRLNSKLTSLISQLFELVIGKPIKTIDQPETTMLLLQFRHKKHHEGHATKDLLNLIATSLKMVVQQQKQWKLNEAQLDSGQGAQIVG